MTGEQARRHHACAVDDCPKPLPHHILMCRPHWRMVPRPMRHEVTATWRRAVRLSDAQLANAARVDAIRDYLAARKAAVEFANGRVGRE